MTTTKSAGLMRWLRSEDAFSRLGTMTYGWLLFSAGFAAALALDSLWRALGFAALALAVGVVLWMAERR